METPANPITEQQVARRMKISVKLLRENPELFETCKSMIAARDELKLLRAAIREAKMKPPGPVR